MDYKYYKAVNRFEEDGDMILKTKKQRKRHIGLLCCFLYILLSGRGSAFVFQRSFDEAFKQRVRAVGPGFQLRMALGSDKERMVRKLDHLNDPSVRRNSGEQHAVVTQYLTVIVIYLVAVTVALMDDFLAVQGIGSGGFVQNAGVGAQP